MIDRIPIRRALVSVYDKTGLDDLVRGLAAAGVELVSTGGSATRIDSLGLPVTRVEDLTGFPECLDGRVKTLHPKVHAGILADRRLDSHVQQLEHLGIAPFDLVVSNLYPFVQTVTSGATPDQCVEQIDIGGPSMVRAAAKNHPSVAIVTSPGRYADVLAALAAGGFTLEQRKRLAAEAFAHTASYDVAVASWMAAGPEHGGLTDTSDGTGFPAWTGATWTRSAVLRYGENPHQPAALYGHWRGGLAAAEQLHGKEMSYNNYVDTDAARRAANDFAAPAVAIIKHANPCGIATGADVAEAHRKAHACDPVSAFGGVIAVNRPVTEELAEQVSEIFTEVIVAPDYDDGALEVLQAKKNIRILRCPPDAHPDAVEFRGISGGVLVQRVDHVDAPGDDPATWTLATGEAAPDDVLADLAFAWRACRAVKSNAILLAHDGASVGIGMGQVNRVDSCRLAVSRAGERAAGSVAASDAFFPFEDGPQDPHRRRHPGDRPAGRLGTRRADRQGLPGRRRDHVLHRHPPLLPLTSRTDEMTAKILDGTATLRTIKAELTERVAALRERGVTPGLGTVLVGDDPGSHWYVGAKHKDCASIGITSMRRDLPATATQAEVEAVIDELNADPSCTGFIVQQPTGLDEFALLSRVDPDKDVDGLHPTNLGKLVLGESGPLPCTPVGVIELLRRHGVQIEGAEVVVVGRGITVGRPLGLLLTRRSENATVTLCHTRTRDLAAHTRTADIVVAAAGVPDIITADMVKPGAAVLDVGVSRVDGKIAGDVAADVAEVAGWVSPNPGGVGPMTRAMLLTNVVDIAEETAH